MADVIFVKFQNGHIVKLEGEFAIHSFVILERLKYEGLVSVRNVWNRIGLLEPDPRVKDMIMARLFQSPRCVKDFMQVESIPNEWFATLMKELKDHLTYLLFPMAPELDIWRESLYGLGFGGALLRSLAHVTPGPSTYFLHDWGSW